MTAVMLSDPQRAALAKIACGLEAATGLVLLCGPAGVGKTLVLDELARSLPPRGQTARRECVADWLSWSGDLPAVVLADDAHLATEGDLGRLLDRCRRAGPTSLVLAGEGRLLSLVSRDPRLEQAVRIRVSLLPGTLADTLEVLARVFAAAPLPGPAFDEAAVATIHEIAGGVPGAIVRLADLAGVLASARPDGRLSADDIEAIHRRIAPQAA
jgi:type II secretory pathway predicted ATPase ExeA